MVIGKEDRRIIGIGARNSQEHDSNGRENEMDVRIEEDHKNSVDRTTDHNDHGGNRGGCWYRE
jgi:hypothetical protein